MPPLPAYSLTVRVDGDSEIGEMFRLDGRSIAISAQDLRNLFCSLAKDGHGDVGDRLHHQAVLHAFFERKKLRPLVVVP